MGSNTNNTYGLKAGANKLEEVNMAFSLMERAVAALDTTGQNAGIKTIYVPVEGQLVFSSSFGISNGASIFINGAMLTEGLDYTNNVNNFVLTKPAELGDDVVLINAIPLAGNNGANGSFSSSDGKTITVENGFITSIV